MGNPNTPSENKQFETAGQLRKDQELKELDNEQDRILRLSAETPEQRDMLENPEKKRAIKGVITVDDDGAIQCLPKKAKKLRNKKFEHDADLDGARKSATEKANDSLHTLDEKLERATASMKDAVSDEKKAGGSVLTNLPTPEVGEYVNGARTKRIVAMKAVDILLQAKKDGEKKESFVAKLERVLIDGKFTEADAKVFTATLPEVLSAETLETATSALKQLSNIAPLLSAEETADWKSTIQTALDEVHLEQNKHIFEQFKDGDIFNAQGTTDFMARVIIERSFIGDAFDSAFLTKQLEALKLDSGDVRLIVNYFDSSIKVMQTASIETRPTIDAMKAGMLEMLKKKLETNTALNDLSAVHTEAMAKIKAEKDKDPLYPFAEQASLYASIMAGAGVAQTGIWWEWIKTLPTNVTPDATLRDLLDRDAALLQAQKALTDIEKQGANDDDDFDEAVTDLKSVYDTLEKKQGLGTAVGPKEVKNQLRDGKDLVKMSYEIFKELEGNDAYQNTMNPAVRHTAYYLAMTESLEAAESYLQNPEVFEFTEKDKVDGMFAFKKRVDKSELLSGGDVLTDMRQFGVGVKPAPLMILLHEKDQKGLPLSEGPAGFTNWFASENDAPPALEAILFDIQPGRKQALIDAFTIGQDNDTITSTKARQIIKNLQEHLYAQASDRQLNEDQINARERRIGDPLNALRAGVDSVKNMFVNGDGVEKALAAGLVFGGLYLLYRMWKSKGGRTAIVGSLLFFGADIALKRSTGSGVLDRLHLNFMNEKDRTSSLEQFIRRNDKESRYSFLDSEPGRVAVQQIMDPKNPIPVSALLEWRKKALAGGKADYSQGAPENLQVRRVVTAMGTQAGYKAASGENKRKAYELCFLAFEAFCGDVAEKNELGGTTAHDKADRGAELIKQRYVDFTEPFLQDIKFAEIFKEGCPKKGITALEILTYERPTEATVDALENSTYTEYFFAKIGIPFALGMEYLRKGKNLLEIKKIQLEKHGPDYLASATEGVMSSVDTFTIWARNTWFKGKREVGQDLQGTWEYLKGLMNDGYLQVTTKGPVVFTWTIETSVNAAKFTKEKGVEIYRALLDNQVTGTVLQGFESAFNAAIGMPVQDALVETLATEKSFKEIMNPIFARMSVNAPTDKVMEQWLLLSGAFELKNKKLEPIANKHESLLRLELLRREIFSYFAARKIHHIAQKGSQTDFDPTEKLNIDWSTINLVNVADKEGQGGFMFQLEDSAPEKLTYEYLRSRYKEAEVLALLTKEKAWEGWWEYAQEHQGGVVGGGAAVLDTLLGWLMRSDSLEYYKHDLDAYIDPLKKEADILFAGDDDGREIYEEYINTLVASSLLESSYSTDASNTGVAGTFNIAEAKQLLLHLKKTRGHAPDPEKVKTLLDLKSFKVTDVATKPHELDLIEKNKNLANKTQGLPPEQKEGKEDTEEVKETPIDLEKQQAADTGIDTFLASKTYASAKTEYHERLVHASETLKRSIATNIVNDMNNVAALHALSLARDTFEQPREKERMQYAIDLGILKLLKQPNGVLSQLPNLSDANKEAIQSELLAFYKCTSQYSAPLLQDTLSMAIEFTFNNGNYGDTTKKLDAYNKFLKESGAPEVVIDRKVNAALGSKIKNDAVARFTAEDTVRSPRDMAIGVMQRIREIEKVLPPMAEVEETK